MIHRFVRFQNLGEVAGLDLFEQMGSVAGTAVDQRGNLVGQLDGGKLTALLANGNGQSGAFVPGAAY